MSTQDEDVEARKNREDVICGCCPAGKYCRYCPCAGGGLHFETPDLFMYNQWTQRPSILFLIYRVVVTLYFTCIGIYSVIAYEFEPRWKLAVYLTRWAFYLLICTEILKTLLVILGYTHSRNMASDAALNERVTSMIKVTWVLNNTSVTSAFVITVLYWNIVHTGAELVDIRTITTHALNSLYVAFDVCVTAIPTRFYQWHHPLIFGVIYEVFSVIYWAAGGTGQRHEPYIYTALDYGSNPGKAMTWLLAVIAFGLLVHVLHFAAYKLRLSIYNKRNKAKMQTTVGTEAM